MWLYVYVNVYFQSPTNSMKPKHSVNSIKNYRTKQLVVFGAFYVTAFCSLQAQYTDSLTTRHDKATIALTASFPNHFSLKSYFIPGFLTAYGMFALRNEELIEFDNSIKNEVWTEPKHKPITVDNYLQYAPGLAVFGLRAAGIYGKNNLRDEALLYLISNAVMGAMVNPLKMATHLQRPDGFGRNAFPSGHTATAFVGAEFLNQEYKDRSPWFSVAGYTLATGVGVMRIYNNRHWMRDVVAGAGIGIISTKFTYWVYPKIRKILFEKKDCEKINSYELSHLL
jgi:membrane-associated phospholipid phosphatase